MGWSNFIIINDLKLIFEVSRYVSEESFDFFNENLDKLVTETENFNPEVLEKKAIELNISDLSSMTKITDYSLIFQELNNAHFLLRFLKGREIDFSIVDEFVFEDMKDNYKDYKRVIL